MELTDSRRADIVAYVSEAREVLCVLHDFATGRLLRKDVSRVLALLDDIDQALPKAPAEVAA